MRADLTKDRIVLQFKYDPALISRVRQIRGRKYNPDRRVWYVPVAAWKQVQELGFKFTPALKEHLQKRNTIRRRSVEELAKRLDELDIPLRPYQREGVLRIEECDGRILIGDEMGLGKTIQVMSWIRARGEEVFPVLVLCPPHLRENWRDEFNKWWPNQDVRVVRSTKDELDGDIVIAGYSYCSRTTISRKFRTVVLDECHYIKGKSKRTTATKRVARQAQYILALSGTPVVSRPVEFFNVLSLLNNIEFNNWWHYVDRYCAPVYTKFGMDVSGASNLDELHERIRPLFLRRTKDQVLHELPSKQRTIIKIDVGTRIHELHRVQDELERLAKPAMTIVGAMKRKAAELKLDAMETWIRDFLYSTGRKLVVFSVHHDITDALVNAFSNTNHVVCDGRTKDKHQAVQAFQNDPTVRVMFAGLQAMNSGVTLTAASDVLFTELGWTPAEHDQAEDRVHRIGQRSSSVNAWYILAQHTIEEKVFELLEQKRQVVNQIIEGKPLSSTQQRILNETESEFAQRILQSM